MNSVQKSRMSLKLFVKSGIAGLLMASLAIPAWAGEFTVTPVRIYMAPKDRAIAVTITNEGDDELVMQADLFVWKQKSDGQDDLTLTEDMFLSPPIIKMAPKSRQVVRLARLKATKPAEQLTYRMIVREIPEARAEKKDLQLQIALAFSMPVFITPADAKPKLDCTIERASAGLVKALCANTGNAHSHPVSFALTSSTGEMLATQDSGGYLLAGISRSFDMKSVKGNIPSGKAKLSVTLDDATTRDYDVTIAN
jgi:fimbrial chaperone protein